MESINITDIIRDVKIALDENDVTGANNVLAGDNDQLQYDALIRSKITEAARTTHETAPSVMLDGKPVINATATGTQNGIGTVTLPADFMRLVIFKMSDWAKPVFEPISDTDPAYAMQRSEYMGIRGGKNNPVAAITTNASGEKVMECFSSSTFSIEKYIYIPIPRIYTASGQEKIDICKLLYTATIYQCAGLVAVTYKDEQAKNLFEIAKSYLS